MQARRGCQMAEAILGAYARTRERGNEDDVLHVEAEGTSTWVSDVDKHPWERIPTMRGT